MHTLESATDYMRRNKNPYWWVTQGTARVATNTDVEDLDESLKDFQDKMKYLPDGKYTLESSKKVKDRSSSLKIGFETGQTDSPMPTQQSNNPWGVSDAVYKNLQDEMRHKVLMEQLMVKMGNFLDEWPDYKKKIDTLWTEDKDGDGIPDILDMAKKGSDVAANIANMKKAWEGASRL